MLIYLAGSIPKGDKAAKQQEDWRTRYRVHLKDIPGATFIDPFDRELDERDFLLVFGADCKHIRECDLVVVNGESRLGVGTAQEMVIAKYFKKHVISVVPKNSHHRKTNLVFNGKLVADWIHPFIYSWSDQVVEDLRHVNGQLDKIMAREPKNITVIEQAIAYAESEVSQVR